ncbi:MAG TPA: hypothetical protein VLA78_10355 [Paracoccaceae bacterium]|nr:hypothetical protein [Paracoccaceae bacterium]
MPVQDPVPDCQFGKIVTVLRPGLLADRRGRETLVVCGAARGLTSVVSYALVELGYPMGPVRGPHNHEDMEFQNVLVAASVRERSLRRMPGLPGLIARRNAANPRWGFKVPLAVEYMPELQGMLRDPVFVICLRSPAGVMRSIHARPHDVEGDVVWLMRKGFGAYAAVHAAAARLSAPILLADMDAARLAPRVFLDELCAALDLAGDLDALAARIARPGYKEVQGT